MARSYCAAISADISSKVSSVCFSLQTEMPLFTRSIVSDSSANLQVTVSDLSWFKNGIFQFTVPTKNLVLLLSFLPALVQWGWRGELETQNVKVVA